jgi:hypothetical protein
LQTFHPFAFFLLYEESTSSKDANFSTVKEPTEKTKHHQNPGIKPQIYHDHAFAGFLIGFAVRSVE